MNSGDWLVKKKERKEEDIWNEIFQKISFFILRLSERAKINF